MLQRYYTKCAIAEQTKSAIISSVCFKSRALNFLFFRSRLGLASASKSNVVESNDRAVGKLVNPDLEKVCLDESFANATNEVTLQSRSLHRSAYQDHPKSIVNHFYEESKHEEWLKPEREEQSLEKIAKLAKDPCAGNSTVVGSQKLREETHDNSKASTVPLGQELDKASKEDQEIEMQEIQSGPDANKDENVTIVTVHKQGSNQEASEETNDETFHTKL